ncbi:MAG: TolC family protein, partial [Candidatus Eisenbacteria bacterium]
GTRRVENRRMKARRTKETTAKRNLTTHEGAQKSLRAVTRRLGLSCLVAPTFLWGVFVIGPAVVTAGSASAAAPTGAVAVSAGVTPGSAAAPARLAATTAGGEPRKLSLKESIEIALASNKALLIQKHEVERMNAQVIQARSAAFPNLSGNTGYVLSRGTYNFGGSEGFSFNIDDEYVQGSLTLMQPIYTAGRTGAALRAARAARGYARENLEGATKEIVYVVRASFGGVLLAKKMAALAQESLELAAAHLGNVEQLYNQGVASEYELIRARVQVSQLMPERIRAESELDRALIVFRNTLGFSADESVEPEGELECKPIGISAPEAFELAKKKRNEITVSQLRVFGMKAALDVAKADRYPSLSFVANASMEAKEPTFDSNEWRSKMWNASVALSLPLFDGLRTKGKIRQTKAEYEQARLLSDQTLDAVRLEVEQAVSRHREARRLVEAQAASVEQARKGFDIASIRYTNGVGTQLEVLDAQVALSRARTNYFMSVYEHFMSVAELERATGASFE